MNEAGSGDVGIEEEVAESYRATVEKGAARLHRSWRALVTTGFVGGVEIGLGILGYLAVLHGTGSHLLAGLAFGIGLVALFLAHGSCSPRGSCSPSWHCSPGVERRCNWCGSGVSPS